MATDTSANGAAKDATAVATANIAASAGTGGPGHSSSTKKKFGKNLNKLTAPPTAPAPQGGAKTNASSKNGLLLLSNKRSSSGTNAAATNLANTSSNNGGASGGGILSTKANLASSKPLPNLGLHTEYNPSTHDALMGVVVGASRIESQQKPDAWGVAEKHQSVDTVDLASPRSEDKEFQIMTTQPEMERPASNQEHNYSEDYEDYHQPGEFRSSNWDEYGGRNLPGEKEGNTGVLLDADSGNDNQVAYMTKLAKERAERRRDEEEARFAQQKERAAQRLRDLEDRMASKQTPTSDDRLGAMGESGFQGPETDVSPRERSSPRKLFDPNETAKSYSALVRGSSSTPQPENGENNLRNLAATNDIQSTDPQSFQRNQGVIQLTSYDATDRGTRGADTGPRMLFDPKSGSMVEVSSREDSGEKKKKNRRLRKKKSSCDGGVEESRVEPKGRTVRKDEGNNGQIRGKGTVDPSIKSRRDNRKGKITVSRRLPRTCGVLFSRDKKGIFVSADKCDGDLGYGVHSVPGGKVKNPEAYSAFVQSQKQAKHRNGSRAEKALDSDESPKSSTNDGFAVQQPVFDWVKPNEKIELITGVDESPTLQATAREWAPSNPTFPVVEQKNHGLSSARSLDDHENGEDDGDEPVSHFPRTTNHFFPFTTCIANDFVLLVLYLPTVWAGI
jgi:hypothetical protein